MALRVPKATSRCLGGSSSLSSASPSNHGRCVRSRGAGRPVFGDVSAKQQRNTTFAVACRSPPSASSSGRRQAGRGGRSGHSLLFDKSRKKAAQEASKRRSSSINTTSSSQSENSATTKAKSARGKAKTKRKDRELKGTTASKWAIHAALEDALHDALESAKPKLKHPPPSNLGPGDPCEQLGTGKKGKLPVPRPPTPVKISKANVKVRVARNSEELKAVAALRVSIFQQFVNPKQQQQQAQEQSVAQKERRSTTRASNEKSKGEDYQRGNTNTLPPRPITSPQSSSFGATATRAQSRMLARQQMVSSSSAVSAVSPVPVPVLEELSSTSTSTSSDSPRPSSSQSESNDSSSLSHHQRPSSLSMKFNRGRGGGRGGGQHVEIDLKEQWLRKQSGLEAARIYNLGERCICLLAVYHPKNEEEKLLLRSKANEGFTEMKLQGRENQGTQAQANGSIGERLLSPFIKWHAPPVPKVPTMHLNKDEEKGKQLEMKHKQLEDEDGALIIGTLNIHFGQPFRPKPKVTHMGRGGPLKQGGNNSSRGILRSVENAGGQNLSASTKARVLNSLWRMKQQQHQQQPQPQPQPRQTKQLDFFQLPSEEKALQKLSRDCKQAYIFNLCVSPVFRRQGIATMLLDRAQEIATKKGVKECFLHVDFGNDAAEKLYAENGYVLEEDEEGKWRYIAGSRKRQLMRKRIP